MGKEIQESIKNTFRITRNIIAECGPRLTGSTAAQRSAGMLKQELDTFCDKTVLENFTVHPKAFLGWIRILVLFYIAGVVLLWFGLPLAAAILATSGMVIMSLQFFLYIKLLDPFYPAKKGSNVIGTLEPENEVTQQVIISGHHDSARIFNFFIHQPSWYAVRVMGGIGSVVLLMVSAWISLLLQTGSRALPGWFNIIYGILTLLLVIVLQLWFFASNKGTPGAGDNLISSAAAVETGRYFADLRKQGKGLKNTRLILASWDAEEAGLRGARAYANAHKKEFSAIPTWNFNVDCPYSSESLFFLTSDINGSVKLSESMAKECRNICTDLGFSAEVKPIEFLTGGTDAAELAKKGVQATTLMGMPWGNTARALVYHTPADTPENIEEKAIEAVLLCARRFVEITDAKRI